MDKPGAKQFSLGFKKQKPGGVSRLCIADSLNYFSFDQLERGQFSYTRKNFLALSPSTLAFSSWVKSGRSIVS